MQKPITIIVQEFREEIVKAINNSGLPWWKVKDELEFLILPQVKQCAMQEEQAERQEYQKSLEEEEKQKLALENKFITEQKVLAEQQRDEAIRTKTYFVEGRDAKLSGQVGGLVKENNRLKDNLYGNRNYRTIRAVASMNHLSDRDISWRRLKAYCITNNLQIKKVQDEKFGTISSYPVEAFNAVYPELTIK